MYLAVVHVGQVLENRHSMTKKWNETQINPKLTVLQNASERLVFEVHGMSCVSPMFSRLTSSRKETGQATVLATSLQSRAVYSHTVQ